MLEDVQQLRVRQTVVDEGAAPLGPHQPGFAQRSKVKRNVGLREFRSLDDIGHGTAFQPQAQKDAQPVRLAEQFHDLGQPLDSSFLALDTHISDSSYVLLLMS